MSITLFLKFKLTLGHIVLIKSFFIFTSYDYYHYLTKPANRKRMFMEDQEVTNAFL